jgi:Flp pilus assembly protein TadD
MNNEHNASQFKEQGNQAYKTGDYKRALTLYTKAIELNPKDAAFYLNRALCYYNMKNYN